ncbi:ATP-binding protein [Streptomyces sp. Lzd4kr]|nr:ATP-binding protein [Streptomyces sp. Lzd4kr]
MNSDGAVPLGYRVQLGRDRAFTGRTDEISLFRAALSGTEQAPPVLYVHGPGGIGKTMLLRRLATEARDAGRLVVKVDCSIIEYTRETFESDAGAALGQTATVLLVDTFERCQGLEGWLRHRFLPRLPAGSVVVIAGRQAPDPQWTLDPGWTELLRPVALRNLAPKEAEELLRRQGVPQQTWSALLSFTGGHPLALTLAASVAVRDGVATADWKPGREVIATLLVRLIDDAPSTLHRRALEVCALAQLTTETLLRTVLGDHASRAFAWLRGLPFVETARHGIYPHDVVREALCADLRWRDPEGYAELHHELSCYLFDRISLSSESGMPAAVGAFMYLNRTDRRMFDYDSWCQEGEVQLADCTPEDHETVIALAGELEGPESAGIVRFWLERQPQAFRVCRTTQDNLIVGFSAWLRLTDPTGTHGDPVVVAAWEHARTTSALRDGEHLAVARFAVTCPSYPRASPVEDLHRWRSFAEIARAEGRLAWSYFAVQAGDSWVPYLASLGLNCIGLPEIGHRGYRLFANDWRAQPVWAWMEERSRLMLSGLPGVARTPDGHGGGTCRGDLLVLSRPEFDAAVRDALRSLGRPGELAVNPLTRSRLTTERGRDLRDTLREAVEGLRAERGGEKYHRAVAATYLTNTTPTQQAVAARLGLPFSTFRRHLATGVQRVCDALWHREIHGSLAQPAGHGDPQPPVREWSKG